MKSLLIHTIIATLLGMNMGVAMSRKSPAISYILSILMIVLSFYLTIN